MRAGAGGSRPGGVARRDLLIVVLVLAGLVAGAVARPEVRRGETVLTLAGLTLPPTCWFRAVTGIPCAGCGLTRSVVLLLHGRPGESRTQHPFGTVALALGLLALPPRAASALGHGRRWVARYDRVWGVALATSLVLLLAWWGAGLAARALAAGGLV